MRSVKASELSADNIGQWLVVNDGQSGGRGPLLEITRIPNVAPNGRGPADREGVYLVLDEGGAGTRRVEALLELDKEVMVGDSPDEILLAEALR